MIIFALTMRTPWPCSPLPFPPVTEYGLGILSVPVYPGHVHRTYLRLFLLLFPLYLRPPLSGARIVQYSIARKKSMHRPPVPARLLSVLPMVIFLSAALDCLQSAPLFVFASTFRALYPHVTYTHNQL